MLFIGAPDAAVRAALILTLVAVGGLRGRPLSRAGALATAFLLLLVLDPGALVRPGFQLSFAGAGGLVLLARPIEASLRRVLPSNQVRGFRRAVAASVAATLTTLPILAWHFDRVSVVGIPATVLSTPLVAAVIPGAVFSLLADTLHADLGSFLAGGVDLLIVLLLGATRLIGDLPFAVVWVPEAGSWRPDWGRPRPSCSSLVRAAWARLRARSWCRPAQWSRLFCFPWRTPWPWVGGSSSLFLDVGTRGRDCHSLAAGPVASRGHRPGAPSGLAPSSLRDWWLCDAVALESSRV